MENFEIADGVTIPPGAYHWIRYRLEAEFAAKRKVSGQISWWFGRFYEGTLAQFKVDMTWKPSESFALDLAGEYNTADLPFGEFTQELVSGRVKINFTPNLQVKSLIQYDNKTRDVGTNTRLRATTGDATFLPTRFSHRSVRWAGNSVVALPLRIASPR